MRTIEQRADAILEDFPAETIKANFDFIFQGYLNVSDGMAGEDLAELFEMNNRIADLFKAREQEIQKKTDHNKPLSTATGGKPSNYNF